MKLISNLSTHVFVIIIKFQEKIKPVKWSFLNFNLNSQNFAECKNQDYMSRAMGKRVFGVNLAILRFCDFYTGHYMKSKLVFV